MKEYFVYAYGNWDGKGYYVKPNLDWADSLGDNCIWQEEKEVIERIMKQDSRKFCYKFEIIEIEGEE